MLVVATLRTRPVGVDQMPEGHLLVRSTGHAVRRQLSEFASLTELAREVLDSPLDFLSLVRVGRLRGTEVNLRASDQLRARAVWAVAYLGLLLAGGHSEADQAVN